MDFENKKSSQEIHYSRYLASYLNELEQSGKRFWFGDFYKWLLSIGLPKDEARFITAWARCGKMELEHDVKKYIETLSD